MKVKILPDQVVNQIAAGEVVERPASVVRELVENSVDAGADDITVEIEEGGRSLIRITDNGSGMERDDALLALERHATSKIRSAEDLTNIHTLGFRGEALPSIASVSKLTITTRTAEGSSGTQIVIHAGAVKEVKACPAPKGTILEVRALFYEAPVRRKFLKSPRYEELRVKQWMLGSALAHPNIRFRLIVDGKEKLNLPKRENSVARGRGIFTGSTVDIDTVEEGIELTGCVGHPSLAHGDASGFLVLVNGRVVSDRLVLKAVKEGFSSTLKDREFPLGFLSLGINPESVDVNVHPQKNEVRFVEPQRVFVAVRRAVERSTRDFRGPATVMERPATYGSAPSPESYFSTPSSDSDFSYSESPVAPITGTQAMLTMESSNGGQKSSPFKYSDLKFLGQALGCYLFLERAGRVYVLDMHAAHERYQYNLVRERYKSKSLESQQLLVPSSVEVGERGVARIQELTSLLLEFGFEVEPFGPTSVLIRSVPTILKGRDPTSVIRDVAAVSEDELADGRLSEMVDKISARIACHGSVRSGEGLTSEEAHALLESLEESEWSGACPHGRPVLVSFSEPEIERWFGRDR